MGKQFKLVLGPICGHSYLGETCDKEPGHFGAHANGHAFWTPQSDCDPEDPRFEPKLRRVTRPVRP